MPLGLGLGISKLKSLVSGLRVRFQGNATITAALDGILRDLSADFVSNGTVTAALEAIKLLSVDFSGDGTLTADLASFTGLLDDYPNAAVAYSVRLLKSDYTGALVTIRRSSDNAEKDFYPDSNFELSLSSEDGASTSLSSWIGSDNGFIVTWYDQSGNNNNATNAAASTQPQLLNAGAFITMSGKPTGQGNTARLLNISTPLTGVSAFSMYITGGNSTTGRMVADNNSFNHFIEGGVSSNRIRVVSVVNLSSRIFQNNSIISWDRNGANATVYENNVLNTSTASMGTSNAEFGQIFNVNSSGANGTDGQISEVVIWDSDQSANRDGITTNINDYYSIY